MTEPLSEVAVPYKRILLKLSGEALAGESRFGFDFEKVKQFPFKANSAYAFVVNNTIGKRSWHGREKLPSGAGVRNTLLNTFYEEQREGYYGYLGAGLTKAA